MRGGGPKLVLASTSPRRRELLARLGRPFRVIPPEADETVAKGLSPAENAELLAARKAQSVANRLKDGLVIAADTLVAAGKDVIGKPRDCAHAVKILQRLSRGPHRVITGVCLIDARTGRRRVASDQTVVTMRRMTRAEIRAYVDSGEALGKAGAYAIQETGDRFVERVQGSLSNVVGLPLELLQRMLKEFDRTETTRK
jgi:septum formation protein